jgi:hypothetical protein
VALCCVGFDVGFGATDTREIFGFIVPLEEMDVLGLLDVIELLIELFGLGRIDALLEYKEFWVSGIVLTSFSSKKSVSSFFSSIEFSPDIS